MTGWANPAAQRMSNPAAPLAQTGAQSSPYAQQTQVGGGVHYNMFTPQPSHGHEWVWNGKSVTITEFAHLAYGTTPQRTMFLLKYSDEHKEIK